MPQPPAKKQNMDDGKRDVIVFSAPGLKPDVRLLVFDKQEYHAHSVILKLYSGFFRKFLDSPEKPAFDHTSTSPFRYTWITQIDQDQTWSLVSLPPNKAAIDFNSPKLRIASQQILEENLFKKLLFVMYYKRVIVDTPQELSELTAMADYYFALQVLSSALDGILLRSRSMTDTLINNVESVLEVAYKLRSPVLFRECIILSIGPWSDPIFHGFKNKILRKTAQTAHQQVCARLAKAHHYVLQRSSQHKNVQIELSKLTSSAFNDSNPLFIPQYYRQVLDIFEELEDDACELPAMDTLLESHLVLQEDPEAGVDTFKDYFLCAEIEDEDLPWDQNQIDW